MDIAVFIIGTFFALVISGIISLIIGIPALIYIIYPVLMVFIIAMSDKDI